MSAKKQHTKSRQNLKQENEKTILDVIENLGKVFLAGLFGVFSNFGMQGTLTISLFICINLWSSDETKEKIVKRFILFEGWQGLSLPIYMLAGFALILAGQHFFFKRKYRIIQDKNKELESNISELKGQIKGLKKRT